MTDVALGPMRMVTDPVLILMLLPEGPEIVVISVCAETKVDSVTPELSVTALTEVAAAELPLTATGLTLEALSDDTKVTLPPPRIERTFSDEAEGMLPVGAGPGLAEAAGNSLMDVIAGEKMAAVEDASVPADEALCKADDSAEESTELSGGSRKSLPSEVGAGSPLVPARDPDGSPRTMLDCDAHTDSGMLYGLYDVGWDPDAQVVVVVEMASGELGAEVETTVVLYSLSREDVKVSGQTVVETAVLSVMTATLLCRTGQFSSHGGQPRIVTLEVSQTYEVETAGNRSTTTILVIVWWMTA